MLLFRWHNQIRSFDFNNILIDKKSQENVLVYHISHKALNGPEPLRIRLDKINGYIRIYNGNR